jgi:hypothetical protein
MPSYYWAARTVLHGGNVTLVWTKSCPDSISPSFNPTKKTLLLVHGLQPDCVLNGDQFALNGDLDAILGPWIQMGYNVGAFLWTQFADEEIINFVWSEDQIYTTRSFVKMRYKIRTSKGKIIARDAPMNMSVTDYFIQAWKAHWPNNQEVGPEIRVVGHSLGTQLVMNSAYHIYMDDSIDRKPDRLALLDAVMSPHNKMYFMNSPCGKTITANMGCRARMFVTLASIPIEYYKSSFINRCIFASREDKDLVEYTAFTTVRFGMWGDHPLGSCWDKRLLHGLKHAKKYMKDLAFQMTAQHIYIVPYYLMSLFYVPHRCMLSPSGNKTKAKVCNPLKSLALSAAMASSDVLSWGQPPMSPTERKLCFSQFINDNNTKGEMTLTPDDDYFYLKYCKTVHT